MDRNYPSYQYGNHCYNYDLMCAVVYNEPKQAKIIKTQRKRPNKQQRQALIAQKLILILKNKKLWTPLS